MISEHPTLAPFMPRRANVRRADSAILGATGASEIMAERELVIKTQPSGVSSGD
jgi:hypothetical protein